MTEEELQNDLGQDNNKETQVREYKLKPDFNEIKEVIKHIQKRMHFNILKTIYAFANTDGGELYIGIKEHKENQKNIETKKQKLEIVGLDEEAKNQVDGIIERVSPKILKDNQIIELKFKRTVIKINVQPLPIYDKPQLLDGVLYYRDGSKTKNVKAFENTPDIYQKEQFYFFLLEGIKSNFQKIQKELSPEIKEDILFNHDLFITGLKSHIKTFAIDHQIINNEDIQEAEELLDEIKKAINSKQKRSSTDIPTLDHEDTNKLIDDFIKTYKNILRGV